MSSDAATSRLPLQRGFSLLEVITVVVMLGVAAGVVLPRLGTASSNTLEAELDAVASVLTAVAQRDAVSSQRLAVEYDPEGNELSTLVFQKTAGAGNFDEEVWRRDPFLGTLRLANTKIVQATVGGSRYDDGAFRMDLAPGTPRPEIVLIATPVSGDLYGSRVYRIELNSGAIDARVRLARPGGEPADISDDDGRATSVDLDQRGLAEDRW